VMMRVTKVKMTFFMSAGWKSDGSERVVDDGGVDSMLQFLLERGDVRTNSCREMEQRQ
jgi:hypothetical protein